MAPKTCPVCGGLVKESRGPITVEFRGERITVPDVQHRRCEGCGETFLNPAAIEATQRAAAAHVRRLRGLLQPGEILAIRESLGYSQARFEKLLRVGQKTVVRWEKGTVFQSATADQLMRLVRDVPAVADVLSGRRLKTTVTCHAGTAANVLDEDWQEELTATSRMRDQDECPALAA